MKLDIALVEPEIPANTGNIARTCVAVGAGLHLVGTLGFKLEDRYLKRAGLDYWPRLDLHIWDTLEDLLHHHTYDGIYYATTKAAACYSEVRFPERSLLVFGKETKGLPESLLLAHPERNIRIPMRAGERSLNLSNSVAIIAYEVCRQHGFPELQTESHYLDPL
ncbi:MAG: tRNA (cytidine(34)-2'-O)-methyltransferase [Oscillospiraceae bacterium]|nr:tRNA (cytidine(34)-2'-O)-methyltransferase [Oscillospiraceae bacterium]MDD4367687.1 tRNA (cytidine(34)-2'-O)-methyltransferase [Oscillospiraceae bacterium]